MSTYSPSSGDDLPDVQVVFEKQQLGCDPPNDSGSPMRKALSPVSVNIEKTSPPVKATPMRRRKLSHAQQPVEASLRKPWLGNPPERSHLHSSMNSSRQPSWLHSSSAESSMTSANSWIDRLPVKSSASAQRVVSGGTMFDSPPPERKTVRRLVSQVQMREPAGKSDEEQRPAIDLEKAHGRNASRTISLLGKNEVPSLLVDKTWDMEDQTTTSNEHSTASPAPRRLQRRFLSPTKDPGQPFQTPWTKSRQHFPKTETRKQRCNKEISTASESTNTSLDDVFGKLRIFSDEPSNQSLTNPNVEEREEPNNQPSAEPRTPKETIIASPEKITYMSVSPWKPEQKEFWDPEVNFAWIDKHSPPKRSPKKMIDLFISGTMDEKKSRYVQSPEKRLAKKTFDAVKEDLARDFLFELDKVVTDGKLSKLTESTGGLRIVWSNTLLTTAGRANWKCKTTTTTTLTKQTLSSASSSRTGTTTSQHYASIELATKVLTNESDLLNTVAHEFCHLAVFLLHGKPKLAHGAEFKSIGSRVMGAATAKAPTSGDGESRLNIPVAHNIAINVTTRHSYEIEYRFIWRCADCATEVCRHSRSVDPVRQRCGRCTGTLVQVKPVPRGSAKAAKAAANPDGEGKGGKGAAAPKAKERKKTAYQEFTSREMKALTITHKGSSFKEKMTIVSARWSEYRQAQKEKAAAKARGPDADADALAGAVEGLRVQDDDAVVVE